MSANIVNVDSLMFDDVLADIERFISIEGEIDLRDFNESSTVRRFTSAMASLYNQLRMKIEDVRRESIMHSAVRPESIRYLAQSQLAYHPKRKVAPQHPDKDSQGKDIRFTFPNPSLFSNPSPLPRDAILGNLTIDGESYPISMLDNPVISPDNKTVSCRLGIGTWKRFEIKLDDTLNHYDPFHVFHVDDDRDVIDDSGTVYITVQRQQDGSDTDVETVRVINNLYEIAYMREEEKRHLALVTSNYYGGLDINFGDGLIFGNVLYVECSSAVVEVHYFVTSGFIPNFNFIEDNISWDSNFVDDSDEAKMTGRYIFEQRMANGINEESTAQIKTLSPYIAMSNNRIMTNDDFITRVRRIPQIKSCASRPRHINPPANFCSEGGGSVSDFVPTATFELTGLSAGAVNTSNAAQWEQVTDANFPIKPYDPLSTDKSWIRWPRGTVVIDDGRFWLAVMDIGRDGSEGWNSPPSERWVNSSFNIPFWTEVGADFQPLTQLEWDLNYHQQYNFDTLLGFMRVRVLPPVKVEMELDLKAVLRRNLDINARSHSEINEAIRSIVHEYCWELGVFLDFGKIVSDILDLYEVSNCYIENCELYECDERGKRIPEDLLKDVIQNRQFGTVHYIHPVKLNITYQDASKTANWYGRPAKKPDA